MAEKAAVEILSSWRANWLFDGQGPAGNEETGSGPADEETGSAK